MHTKRHKLNQSGFTMPELLIVTVILLPLFVAVMITFIRASDLNDLAKNISVATRECQNQLAEIANTNYTQIYTKYDNSTFTDPTLNGIGIIYVDNSNPNRLIITTSFNWREKNGRMIGEDSNLDGQIDSGEDINNNGILDSIVQLTTTVYQS